MKKLLLVGFIFLSFYSYSQDLCKNIFKNGSELTGIYFYRSHAVWFDKSTNVVATKIKDNGNKGKMALSFTNYAAELSHKLKGLYIKFSDETLYKNPEANINVEYDGGSRFTYNTLFILSEEDINNLKNKKISMANFAFSGDVKLSEEDMEKLRQYIICIDSI